MDYITEVFNYLHKGDGGGDIVSACVYVCVGCGEEGCALFK